MTKRYDLPKYLASAAMKEADSQLRAKHARGEFDDGDPNNPMYNEGYNYATGKRALFGYDQDEFMAKQYK